MENKTVVITGFYSGIGLQTSLELAHQGMQIIGIGRSKYKADEAIKEIKNETGNRQIEFVQCDLSSMNQIREASNTIIKNYERVDILINNAGIINRKKNITDDDLENTFAVSVMASFLLTRLLLEKLLQSSHPKVINLTSEAYKQGRLDFDSFKGNTRYKTMSSYSNAKFAEMLWTYEMAERLSDKNIVFRLIHPGLIPYTGGIKRMPVWVRPIILLMRLFPVAKTIKEGVRPVVEAALEAEGSAEKILYLKEGTPETPIEAINNEEKRKAIWKFLNDITGMPVHLNK
jgi:NAD(P)-dependent dehydrogenase (short-subunit alcohol dehydrogenase family)